MPSVGDSHLLDNSPKNDFISAMALPLGDFVTDGNLHGAGDILGANSQFVGNIHCDDIAWQIGLRHNVGCLYRVTLFHQHFALQR